MVPMLERSAEAGARAEGPVLERSAVHESLAEATTNADDLSGARAKEAIRATVKSHPIS